MSVQKVMSVVEKLIADNRAVFHEDASVAVQFAAGEWNKLVAAFAAAKAELEAPTAAPLAPIDPSQPATAAVGGPVVG